MRTFNPNKQEMFSTIVPLFLLHWTYGIKLSEDNFTESLNKLVNMIVLEMPKCLVVVVSNASTLQVHENVLQMRFSPDSNELVTFLEESYTMKCNGYLIEEESADYFLTSLSEARLIAKGRHPPKVVIIPNNVGNYSKVLFKHKETAYIPDMVAIHIDDTINEEIRFVSVTNNFQGTDKSQNGEVLGVWPRDDIIFFPDKLQDMKGKEIIIGAVNYSPYVLVEPKFDGVEATLFIEFCRKYNCSISILVDDYLWGEIFDNGTGNGVFGNVYLDKADFGCGAFYLWGREHQFIDYSFPYGQGRITLLVPNPTKVKEWKTVFSPFSLTMWTLHVVSVMMAAVIMYGANAVAYKIGQWEGGEFASGIGTFIRAIGMSLLQPPTNLSDSPLRRFFTIFEVLFIFFTTFYSGALSSVLTVPRYNPPIDSPLQLYEAGIRWGGLHEVWIYSIKEATEPHLKGIVDSFEVHDSKTLIDLSKKGDYGLAIELMETGHVTEMDYLSGETYLNHHIMKEELSSSNLVVLFRKGSPYTKKMNQLISRFQAAGIFLLLETRHTMQYTSSRLQTAADISKGSRMEIHRPTNLKLLHIQGAFMLLAIGLCLSIFIFFLEKMRWIPVFMLNNSSILNTIK